METEVSVEGGGSAVDRVDDDRSSSELLAAPGTAAQSFDQKVTAHPVALFRMVECQPGRARRRGQSRACCDAGALARPHAISNPWRGRSTRPPLDHGMRRKSPSLRCWPPAQCGRAIGPALPVRTRTFGSVAVCQQLRQDEACWSLEEIPLSVMA
jgi:hypothetical protein